MQQLGDALRRAREGRNLSVEQAERETRIRARFLLAIENGDLTEIPSRVQARGFVYNYAHYLGLNPGDVIAHFDAIHGDGNSPATPVQNTPAPAPPPAAYPPQAPPAQPSPSPDYPYPAQTPPNPYPTVLPQTQPEPQRPTSPIPRLSTPPTAIPTPLPGVPSPENGVPPPPPETFIGRLLASDVFLISIMALVAVIALGIGGRALGNFSPGEASGEAPAVLPTGENDGTITPTFAPTSTPTATIPPLASDRVRVSFEVTQRNWLRIDVDGENVFEGLAEPDTILQYEGLQEVRVVTGNGAALDVTYNGVNVGPLGERGEVAEQIYTVGGLETLTPTPTPTLTNTPIPSPTGAGDGTAAPEEADNS